MFVQMFKSCGNELLRIVENIYLLIWVSISCYIIMYFFIFQVLNCSRWSTKSKAFQRCLSSRPPLTIMSDEEDMFRESSKWYFIFLNFVVKTMLKSYELLNVWNEVFGNITFSKDRSECLNPRDGMSFIKNNKVLNKPCFYW